MNNEIQQFWQFLQNSQKILLINHIRMDGDAWGSLGGLYLILKEMWKEIRAINDDPVPTGLQFLGNAQIIEPELNVQEYNPDMIISLDSAWVDRLGESYTKWKHVFEKKDVVVIDHHISNPGFGDVNIIEPEASSVCQMLTHILIDLGMGKHITPEAATFLYTWLQTDTNMYATSNTTPATLIAGAKLLEFWANFQLPIQKCFREKTKIQITAWQLAYSKIEFSNEWSVCYVVIDTPDMKQVWLSTEQLTENLKWFINETLVNIEWVKIAFLLYPLANGEIKWSMRCVNNCDVNTICQKFWWGGHIQAAGFQNGASLQEIQKRLLEEIAISIST